MVKVRAAWQIDLRWMPACAELHPPWQAVRFVDFRTGELRQGEVIAKYATQASVLE